ncbi:MAG TPA: acetate--CoA ligase family protein [Sphingomonas sp.]|nr:acetate--CoA ligase family protein [Sphingomonas sp.]
MPNERITDLNRLLRPRSIAIVGASEKPGALGASVLSNLERARFAGAIHLVNPKRDEIGGRPCLRSIDDLPDGVDVAVLAIPRAAVLDAIRALAARRVGAAIIFSAGFAEAGAEGLGDQEEIARIATEANMIVEGPNCLGLVNFVDRIPLTFVEMPDRQQANVRGVAIVSQSGAMAAVLGITLLSRDLALSFSISTGNEAATGVEHYVEWLIDDPHTRVITMVVEHFRNPRRFLAAAARAKAAGKTIVLLHPGRSNAARESAATHTGAMAGDYKVMRLHVERAGVIVAETLEELGDIAEIALRCPAFAAGGAAVLGESGAFKALMLDLAETLGLTLPHITDSDSPALRAALPPFVSVSNPLDITAQGLVEPDLYTRMLTALVEDHRFSCVLLAVIQTDPVTCQIKFPAVLEALRGKAVLKPVVVAGLDEGAEGAARFITELRSLDVPYFPSAERAVRALTRLIEARDRNLASVPTALMPLPGLEGFRDCVPEYQAKALLARAGIKFPKGVLVRTVEQAQDTADMLGYPVAIKAQSATLPHKSDAGGVILGIDSRQAMTEAWERLHRDVGRHMPDLVLDGVLVEMMGKRGVELIIGARNDPAWGPVILAGFGGVQAEILQDVRLIPVDLGIDDIIAELHKLKSAALLNGFRGTPKLDVRAAAQMVALLGHVTASEPSIREIDLNPVILYPEGEGAVALDALIQLVGPE